MVGPTRGVLPPWAGRGRLGVGVRVEPWSTGPRTPSRQSTEWPWSVGGLEAHLEGSRPAPPWSRVTVGTVLACGLWSDAVCACPSLGLPRALAPALLRRLAATSGLPSPRVSLGSSPHRPPRGLQSGICSYPAGVSGSGEGCVKTTGWHRRLAGTDHSLAGGRRRAGQLPGCSACPTAWLGACGL